MNTNHTFKGIFMRVLAVLLMVILVSESAEYSEVVTYAIEAAEENTKEETALSEVYTEIVLNNVCQSSSSVTLDWEEENAEFDGTFVLYRNNEKVETTEETNYTDEDVTAGKSYTYYVEAYNHDEELIGTSAQVVVKILESKSITSNLTLSEDMEVGDLTISNSATLDLDGNTLTVRGSVTMENYSSLKISKGYLKCFGDFNLKTYSYLYMSNANDYIWINGNVNCDSRYANITYLTSGTMEIVGDFTYTCSNYSFSGADDFTVILSGTKLQTVSFANTTSYFKVLELNNYSEAGVYFLGAIQAKKIVRNGCNVNCADIQGDYGWTLKEDEVVKKELVLVAGNLNLNGHTLTIKGDFIQMGGEVKVNGGKLIVEGDYRIQTRMKNNDSYTYTGSSGFLSMNQEEDYVEVDGDFYTSALYSHDGYLTDGTLELKGNFTQTRVCEYNNFAATKNHKVLFSGDNKQTITFANVGRSYSRFANLEITNESEEGVVFDANKVMATGVVNDHGNSTSGYLVPIASTTFTDNAFHGNVYYTESITTPGELIVDGDVIIGNPVYLGGNLTVGKTLTISGYFYVQGNTLKVSENIAHKAGLFYLNAGKVYCQGNYTEEYGYYNDNRLFMTNSADYFSVGGNVVIEGSYNNSNLTAGILEIKGDFIQKTNRYANNFAASGSHTTIFSGTKKQTILFDSVSSYFNICEIKNESEEGIYAPGGINATTLKRNGCNIDFGNDGTFGWTLEEDETIEGDVRLVSDELDLAGYTLTITGNLIQEGGTVNVNGGKLVVKGDYRIQSKTESDGTVSYGKSSGILQMTNTKDYVKVEGDFIQGSTLSHSGKLTDGTLEIKGNFTQENYVVGTNFTASENHKVLFSGDSKQTVTFANVGSSYSRFANLEITNESEGGVVFGANKAMATGVVNDHGNVTSGYLVPIASTTFTDNAFHGNVYYTERITTPGELTVDGDVIIGNPVYLGGNLTVGKTLTISGYFYVQGNTLKVSENIAHKAGLFYLNAGKVYCQGNYTEEYGYYNDNRLFMTNSADYFSVGGNVVIEGSYNNSNLTAGILEIKGDFIQKTNRYANNFAASGSHTTIFSGTKKQTILFDSASSYFNICEIKNESEEGIYAPGGINATTLKRNGCNIDFGNDGTFGWTLEEDETIEGDVRLVSDELDLAGYTLTITGNLIQEGGTVNVNGGKLVVKGDYRIQSKTESDGTVSYGKSSGILQMTNTKDYVKVEGDFIQGSTLSHSGKLTDGTLEIKGNFTQENYVVGTNFTASENHKVLFSGDSKQTVTFANVGSTYSHFANLEITNEREDGVVFDTNKAMAIGVVNDHGNVTSGYLVPIASTTFTDNAFHGNVYYTESITTPGELTVDGDVIIGNPVYLGGNLTVGKTLTISGYFYVQGNTLKVSENIAHKAGLFYLNAGKVYCQGNYTEEYGYYNDNRLFMTNSADYFSVGGNVVIEGSYNNSNLTAGILEIKGDFIQKTNRYANNFAASGSHTTIFSGTKKQTISFDSTSSYFNYVEFRNTSKEGIYATKPVQASKVNNYGSKVNYGDNCMVGWTLTEDTVIEDDMYLVDGTMDLNGHQLTVNGNFVVGGGVLNIHGGSLTVKGDLRMQGEDTSLDTITYTMGTGALVMDDEKDRVYVAGDFAFQSTLDHAENLTAGTMEVEGDFYQFAAINGNFAATADHTLRLIGTGEQIVSFASSSASASRLANLEIANTSAQKVKINSNVYVTENVTDVSGNISGSGAVCVSKLAQIADSTFSGGITLTAANTCDENLTIGGTLTVQNNFDVNGMTIKAKNISITSGKFMVNAGSVQCSNNFAISGSSYLVMQNPLDYIVVSGNFSTTSSYSHSGYLTNGVLEVKGDFTQNVGNSYNFLATEEHKVLLSGKSGTAGRAYIQGITINKVGYSKFATLELTQSSSRYKFSSDLENLCTTLIWSETDNEAPSKVPALYASGSTASTIKIAWDAATDNEGVAGYEVYRNSKKIATTGNTSYVDKNLKPDTAYTYTVYAFDEARNVSKASDEFTVKTLADDEAPSVPENLKIKSKTGSSVTIGWDFAPDNVETTGYRVYRDGELLGEIGNIVEYKDTTAVAGKSYEYQVSACDATGNVSELSSPVTGYAETPSILSMTPSDNSKVGGDSVTLKVYFKNVGNSTGNKVQFSYSEDAGETWEKINANLLGQQTYSSTQLYASTTWDIRGLESGDYLIRATLYDADNNTDTMEVTYMVDKDAPEAPTNVLVTSKDGTITMSFARSASADAQYYTIYRKSGEGTLFTNIAKISAGEYILTYDDNHVQVGETYAYYVTATDAYGQESEASEISWITVEKDETAPVITKITPTGGTKINHKSIMTVTGYDAAGIAYIIMEYLQDEQWMAVEKKAATSNAATFTWDNRELPDGTYSVRFLAEDVNGNLSEEEYTRSYVVDNTGISKIKITSATADSSYVALKWEDVEEEDFSYFQVEQLVDGAFTKVGTTTNVLGMYIKNLKADTEYTFRVVGYDTLGNRGEESEEVTVVTEADTTTPVITNFQPASTVFKNEIALAITVTDNIGAVKAVFEYSLDERTWHDLAVVEKTAATSNTFKYTWDVSEIREGKVYVRVRAYDAAGNENVYVNETNDILTNCYQIDRTAADPITDLRAEGCAGYVSLTWTAPKAEDVAYYKIYRADETSGIYNLLVKKCTTSNYYDTSAEYGETYSYKMTSVDTAGNESAYSNESVADVEEDTEAPTIYSVSPKSGSQVGQNATIKVLVYDNVKVSQLTMEYRNAEESDTWTTVDTMTINATEKLASFIWDTTSLKSGTYEFHIYATDVNGNRSSTFTTSYELDAEAPEASALKATEKNWEIDLTWNASEAEDFDHYELYRRAYNETEYSCVLTSKTDCTYKDTSVTPEVEYRYYVLTYDKNGNYSKSAVVLASADSEDTIAPIADASSDMSGIEGIEIAFDGTGSSDNVKVTKYVWKWGDGSNNSTGAQPTHTYEKAGTYTVVLTVYDAAGNKASTKITVYVGEKETTGKVVVTVVDSRNQPISNAHVYINNNDDIYNKTYITNSSGQVTVTGKTATYNIAAYKTDYLPAETYVDVKAGKTTAAKITLEEGAVVVGNLEVKKLELAEIVAAGIDLSDPSNYNSFTYTVTLTFVESPLPVTYVVTTNGGGEAVEVKKTTSGGGGSLGSGGGVSFKSIRVEPEGETTEEVPMLAYLTDVGTVSWLKEIFSVELGVINAAEPRFTLENCSATLDLPDGLSLASLNTGSQSSTIEMKDIAGQQSDSAIWYIRGDRSGSYSLSANYHATLMPFDTEVNATFATSSDISVETGEGLSLTIMPENAAYVGETYYIQYKLTNTSSRYFYNLKTTFGTYIQPGAYSCVRVIDLDTGEEYLSEEKGANYVIPGVNTCQTVPVMYNGDSIEIGVFAPGDTLYGTTAMSPPASTGEYEEGTYYFKLIDSYAEIVGGQNMGVSVSVSPISSHASCSVVKHVTIDNSTIWGDPVDTASGAYVEDCEALAVNGETTVSLDLNYSSMLTDTVGEMGKGWSHNFQTYLEETTGTLNLHWTPDSVSTFVREEAVTHSVTYGNYLSNGSIALSGELPNEQKYLCISAGLDDAVLQRNEDLTYTLILPSGVIYDFTKIGKLKQMTDKNGRVLTLSYGKDEENGNQITTVTEQATGISIYLYYNAEEKLVKVADQNGRTATFTYEKDCLTSITNALGETTTYTYDEEGHILTKKNADGVTKVTNTYDENGRVTVQNDAKSKTTRFAYDASAKDGSLTITITDRNGNEEKVTSDRMGNIIRKTNAEGETTVNMYDSLSNLLSVTDANNNTTYYKYDENGNQTQITDTEGKTTTMSYDSNNNLTSVIDGDGNRTSYTYDSSNLVTKMAYSSGKVVTYTYNEDKQVKTETIEGLGTKKYTYTDGYMTKVTDMNGNAVTYTYDAYGNLASETNAYGTTTEYTYDKQNRLTKECVLKENGEVYSQITYRYDVDGNQTKVTDVNGNATAYTYDGNGELSTVTRTSDNTTLSYTKDAEGHVTKQTAANGTTRSYAYDKVGRVIEETNEKGETTSYTYNTHGELVKTTDANGNVTKYSYYRNGKLKQETYADGTYLYYSYDSCWNVARITNNEDHSISYEYDSVGNLICQRDPLGNEVTYAYDKYGRLVSQTDANGNRTSYTYDAEGNCLSETNALGQTATYTYDKCNNLVKTTHANEAGENVSIVYTYDRYGRNTSVKDECGNVASMKYDKAGNVTSVTDAEGNVTTYQYDSNNQLISQTDALGVVDTYGYDSMGDLTQLVEQAGTEVEETSTYAYTKTGAISKAVDAENGVSKYTYDSVGNVKTVTDPMEGVTTYTYNGVNQLTEESNAIGATHAYAYNSEGLLETYTDAKEEVTEYTYDNAGRLTQLKDEAGTIRYTYDSNGNVLTVKDSNGVIRRTFDALNRVVSYTDNNDNTITYTYNCMGYLATMQYPNGDVVTYHYYDNGKLKSVTDAEGNITSYQYDGNGRVKEQDNSNGTKDIYAYDAVGQLIRQQVVKGENVISYINYTYDEAGNVISKESSQQEGNIATISSVTMTYDKANRIKTYNGETVTYDKEGNMTYGPSTEGIMTEYTYNCRNQLIQADNVTYAYDAEGNRTAQIDLETGTRTEYTNNTNGDLTQVVLETATCEGKTTTTTYVYGNGLISQNNSDGYLTFHYNNIGSTIVLTNEEGEAEEQYTYGPYGEILSGDTSKTAYLYNGMYGVSTDANGLYYMRARYYNVSIKRFLNQDIVNGSITNSQSLNKFSYVQGNPISLTDPFGLSPNISISGIGHAALDLLGIIPGFDFCDAINAAWYLSEGDYENAALSAVACIPMLGSVVGSGIKWGAKGVANAEKVADTIKLGSRIVGDSGAMLLSGGQAVEAAKQVYTNITNGEGLTWKNAVDVIILGVSVAGMGMAGASIAKSGKSLKAMYKGETAVSNVATSNATKGVSAIAENAGPRKMDLQMSGGKSGRTSTTGIENLLNNRPELTGTTREKLVSTVQDPELSKIVNELYRPGATVGDGGTASILIQEFNNGSSKHLIKATERLKQLKNLSTSGKLGLNDLDIVDELMNDLESAINLYN